MYIGIYWDLVRRKEVEAVVGDEIEWCSSIEGARHLLRVRGPDNLLMPEELFRAEEGYSLYLQLPRWCHVLFWHPQTKHGWERVAATQYTRAHPIHVPECTRSIQRP